MRPAVNRPLVAGLLEDTTLSYREIARRADCSDWSVRAIARELDGDEHGCGPPEEPLTARDWAICAGILVLFLGGMWFVARQLPPPDGSM